jgi:hypothetical protein
MVFNWANMWTKILAVEEEEMYRTEFGDEW